MAMRIIENFNCGVQPAPNDRIMVSWQDVIFEDEATDIRLLGDKESLVFEFEAFEKLCEQGTTLIEQLRRAKLAAPEQELEVVRDMPRGETDGS